MRTQDKPCKLHGARQEEAQQQMMAQVLFDYGPYLLFRFDYGPFSSIWLLLVAALRAPKGGSADDDASGYKPPG